MRLTAFIRAKRKPIMQRRMQGDTMVMLKLLSTNWINRRSEGEMIEVDGYTFAFMSGLMLGMVVTVVILVFWEMK